MRDRTTSFSAAGNGPCLQPRDFTFLRGLFECRTMTLTHATALYFGGRYEAARKRIQALRGAGYVGDRRQRPGQESVLSLTTLAFRALDRSGHLQDYPKLTPEQFAKRSQVSDATLRHELAVMDLKVAIVGSVAKDHRYAIEEFTTWPALSQFVAIHPDQRRRTLVRPDGFLRILRGADDAADGDAGPIEYNFFLELDRSNEVQQILADKALCYRDFYARGGFALRCGATESDFRDHPFRVLMVLQTAERRNNTAITLLNCAPPIKFQAWLTTTAELHRDPLGSVWVCPQDYANATAGTAYSPERARNDRGYVRRSERERLVEERIVKRTLFDSAS